MQGKKQHLMIMSKEKILPDDSDLSRFVDAIEVEVEEFGDYHTLRRKLRKSFGPSAQMPLSPQS